MSIYDYYGTNNPFQDDYFEESAQSNAEFAGPDDNDIDPTYKSTFYDGDFHSKEIVVQDDIVKDKSMLITSANALSNIKIRLGSTKYGITYSNDGIIIDQKRRKPNEPYFGISVDYMKVFEQEALIKYPKYFINRYEFSCWYMALTDEQRAYAAHNVKLPEKYLTKLQETILSQEANLTDRILSVLEIEKSEELSYTNTYLFSGKIHQTKKYPFKGFLLRNTPDEKFDDIDILNLNHNLLIDIVDAYPQKITSRKNEYLDRVCLDYLLEKKENIQLIINKAEIDPTGTIMHFRIDHAWAKELSNLAIINRCIKNPNRILRYAKTPQDKSEFNKIISVLAPGQI